MAGEYQSSHVGSTIDEVVTKFPSHADRHGSGGEDPILPEDIGAPDLDSDGKLAAGQASSHSVEITESVTLTASHMGRTLVCNSASLITLTIPSGLPADSEAEIIRYGTGGVSIAAGSGVTLRSANSLRGVADQYGSAGIKQLDTDEWILTGSLA